MRSRLGWKWFLHKIIYYDRSITLFWSLIRKWIFKYNVWVTETTHLTVLFLTNGDLWVHCLQIPIPILLITVWRFTSATIVSVEASLVSYLAVKKYSKCESFNRCKRGTFENFEFWVWVPLGNIQDRTTFFERVMTLL